MVSKSSNSDMELEDGDCVDVTGEMGRIGGGTITGKELVGGCVEDDESDDGVWEEEEGGGAGKFRGSPVAARAFITASQPLSRVLILSLRSSFSFSLARSLSRCSLEWTSE